MAKGIEPGASGVLHPRLTKYTIRSWVRERETERQRDRQTDRQTDRKTDRECGDRQIEDAETDR